MATDPSAENQISQVEWFASAGLRRRPAVPIPELCLRQAKRFLQAPVDPFHNLGWKLADHPPKETAMKCNQMLALHRRIVQQAGLLSLGSLGFDEQLRRLAGGPSCHGGNHRQNRVVQALVVAVALHDQCRSLFAPARSL